MRTTTTRRRAALAAGALTATLAGAGQAHAAGWTASQPLPDAFIAPSIGFDAAGTATAANLELRSKSPVQSRLEFLVRAADGGWSSQFQADSGPGFFPAQAKVAVAQDGSAAACVTVYDSPNFSPSSTVKRMATYRAAGSSTWEPLTDITGVRHDSTSVLPCVARITPTGTAAVLAARVDTPGDYDTEDDSLVLSVHRPTGTWSSPQQINAAGQSAPWGDLALDADGNATVVWQNRYQKSPQALRSIRVRTRPIASGVLGAPQALTSEQSPASASGGLIAENGAGQAVVAFQDASTLLAVATRDSKFGAWSPVTTIVDKVVASSAGPQAVAVSPSGTAYVSFWMGGHVSSDDQSGLARHPLGYAWSGPKFTTGKEAQAQSAGIAFLGDDAMTVGTGAIGAGGGSDGTGYFQAARWNGGANSPEGAIDLADLGTVVRIDSVLADNIGDVVVLSHDNTIDQRYALTAYDATPPVLLGQQVPDHVGIATAVQLKATFHDAYSAIPSVRWDFGDGSPALTGPTVTHAWSAAGTYDVTATATDAAGNAVTRTFTVTVGASGGAQGESQGDHTAPTVSIALPACKKHEPKKACARDRSRASAWRQLKGRYADDAPGGQVKLTAVRAKRGHRKAKTITASATLGAAGWATQLRGLGAGKWTFTATASDAAGNTTTATITRTLR